MKQSEAFSYALSSSRRSFKVLRRSLTVCCLLSCSLGFLVVLKVSWICWCVCKHFWCSGSVWRHSEAFKMVLSNIEKFMKVRTCSLTFLGVLRCSKAFWGNLICSELIWKVPEGTEVFIYGLQMFWMSWSNCHGFWVVPICFWRFWDVAVGCPEAFRGAHICSE